MLKKREGDVVRRFIEEHYRSTLINKIDEFLNLDFEEFSKKIRAENDTRMPKGQNIYDDEFFYHKQIQNSALLLDNFDLRLD